MIFWIFIALLVFTFYTGTKAMLTRNDCDPVSGGVKHWRVVPGEWICSDGGVELSGR